MNNRAKIRLVFGKNRLRKNGTGLIQIEVYFDRRTRRFFSTGVYVLPNQWDADKGRVNKHHYDNQRLNLIISRQAGDIEDFRLECLRKNRPFTPATLDAFLHNASGDFFTAARQSIMADARLGESKRRVLAHIKVFYEVCGPLRLDEISYNTIKTFDNWLHRQGLKTNTRGSYHKDIKRTLNALRREGLDVPDPYDAFKIEKVKTRRNFLTPAEVRRLAALHYSDGKQATLDRFLISCGTGLRFSDCFMLHSGQVYQAESGRGLVVDLERMRKVEFPVKNPAFLYFDGIADERLRKYLGGDGFLFYRGQSLAVQNAIDNQNLKRIGLDAGLRRPLTFHASRHTALTEVAAQTGNVFSVMKFGGIRKVDTAMVYIHLASEKF